MVETMPLFDERGRRDSQNKKEENYKHYWMFPRQFREIPNILVHTVLTALNRHLIGRSSREPGMEDLIRNELIKLSAMSELNDLNGNIIKQTDLDTGSIRTALAEFKALGLIYTDDQNLYQFTQAGQDILRLDPLKNSENERINRILLAVLMRHRFSSEYARSSHVRISPDIVVRPFVFLMKMFMDPTLDYKVSKEEMYIPIMSCKSLADYEECTKKIKRYREIKNIRSVLGVLSIPATVRNHSFHQILRSRGFILEGSGGMHTLNRHHPLLADIEKYVASYMEDSSEIMTISEHGEWMKRRRVRNVMQSDFIRQTVMGMAEKVSCSEELLSRLQESFTDSQMIMCRKILKELPKNMIEDTFDQKFLKHLADPDESLNAEEDLASLMARFQIEAHLTGRMRNSLTRGNHSDVLLVLPGAPGIMDCKCNEKLDYRFPVGDHRAMKDYVNSVHDLIEKLNLNYPSDTRPSFVCFVSSSCNQSVRKHLERFREETGVPASAISGCDLLFASRSGVSAEHLKEVLSRGSLISAEDFRSVNT